MKRTSNDEVSAPLGEPVLGRPKPPPPPAPGAPPSGLPSPPDEPGAGGSNGSPLCEPVPWASGLDGSGLDGFSESSEHRSAMRVINQRRNAMTRTMSAAHHRPRAARMA